MKQQAKFQNHIWLVKIDAMDGSQEKIISTRKCLSQNEGHSVASRAHLPFEFLMGTLATWMHSDIQYKLSIHAQIVCIWCPGCIDIWLFDHILLRKGYESNTLWEIIETSSELCLASTLIYTTVKQMYELLLTCLIVPRRGNITFAMIMLM